MSDKKEKRGGPRPGSGRPANGDYPHKITVRISEEMHAHLFKKYGGITEAIRALIAADMPD